MSRLLHDTLFSKVLLARPGFVTENTAVSAVWPIEHGEASFADDWSDGLSVVAIKVGLSAPQYEP